MLRKEGEKTKYYLSRKVWEIAIYMQPQLTIDIPYTILSLILVIRSGTEKI